MRKLILALAGFLTIPAMADINVTQGSGKTVHTDTVNGVEYQYIKIIDATTGGTSSATVTNANALKVDGSAVNQPVINATGQSLAIISTNSLTTTMTGFPLVPTGINASTVAVVNGVSAFNATINTALPSGSNNVGTVSGSTITAVFAGAAQPTITNTGFNVNNNPTVVLTTTTVNGSTVAIVNAVGTTLAISGNLTGNQNVAVQSMPTNSSINLNQVNSSAVTVSGNAGEQRVSVELQGSSNTVSQGGAPWSQNITQINGTTILTGGTNGSQGVGGLAASTTTASGNPNPVGIVYNQSHPTLTEGQVIYGQSDNKGNLLTNLQTAIPTGTNNIGTISGSTVTAIFGGAAAAVNADGGLLVHTTNGAAGGTSSNFGAAVPSAGTAAGFKNPGGAMSMGAVDASSNVLVSVNVALPTGTNNVGTVTGSTVSLTSNGVTLTNTSGALDINIKSGGSAGGTASNLGAAIPSQATAAGFQGPGPNLQMGKVTSSSQVVITADTNSAIPVISSTNWIVQGVSGSTTVASGNPVLIGGVYNKSHPTLTEGQVFNIPVTSTGQVMMAMFDSSNNPTLVNADGGLDVHLLNGGSGGTSSNFGAAPPTVGTAIGFTNGTAMSMAKVDASSSVFVVPETGSAFPIVSSVTLNTSQQGNITINAIPTGTNNIGTVSGSTVSVLNFGGAALAVLSTTTLNVSLGANQSVNVAQWSGNTALTGGTNGSIGIGGLAASTATASGNPILIGAVYNKSHPTLTEGQVINAQTDINGNLLTNLIAGSSVAVTINGSAITNTSGALDINIKSGSIANTAFNATPTGTYSTSVSSIGATPTAIDVNSGTKSNGTQRIVIATDQPQFANAVPIVATNTLNVQGVLSNNGAAAASNRMATLPAIAQNAYGNNGASFTQGRDAAMLILSTSGLLGVSPQEDNTFPTYTASTAAFAVINSTTDITELCGNATNKVMVTDLQISCTQTTAGVIPIQVVYRTTAFSGATILTTHADDSNYALSISTPVIGNVNGSTNGTFGQYVDSSQIGCMASGTATPNDIYISPASWRQHGMVLRGTSQCLGVWTQGTAVSGNKFTITWRWKEVIAP